MNVGKCGSCILCVVFVMFISIGVSSAGHGQKPEQKKHDRRIDAGVWIQDYTWAEYSDDGRKLLEETGYLYSLACEFEDLNKYIGWRSGVNLLLGQVDYDGQTWSEIPVQTDVLYIGGKMYLDAVPNYRFGSGLLFKVFNGIGGEWWLRDLNDTQTDTGDLVRGSEEWWWCVYGRLGAGAEYPILKEVNIFSEAGVKIPIYAMNNANLFVAGAPSARLEPDQDFSAFGNIGVRWKQLTVKLAYDSLRFDRSDTVKSGTYDLYQPRSKADLYSLQVSWSKRF